jgi:hypothetical protein
MKAHHTRLFRRLAYGAMAAAFAAPAATAAEPTSPTLRNDIAHFGAQSRRTEHSSPTLWNDEGHFGTGRRASTAGTLPVLEESPAPVVLRVESGFDWVSAGVGAAGGLGLVLVAAAAAAALRGRNRIGTAGA